MSRKYRIPLVMLSVWLMSVPVVSESGEDLGFAAFTNAGDIPKRSPVIHLGGTVSWATAGEFEGSESILADGFWDRRDEVSELVVNTADDTDDGTCNVAHCSLREAITAANTSVGPDIIAFSIPPSDPGYNIGGWWTIRPGNPLPELSEGGTTIDGSTQTNNRGDTNPLGPEIELDGSLAGDWSQGFMVTSANNVIRGLVINRFTGISKAIRLWGASAGDNRVIGNYLGTDPTGAEGRANDWGIEVWLGAHDNIIGGGIPEERNVISGNNQRGIAIGADAHDNLIIGNFIGTTAQGNGPLGNNSNGIDITDGPGNIIGPGNVIAFNGGGIRIVGPESLGNTITANSIYSNTEGIWFHDGGNADLEQPVITSVSTMTVQGTACAGCRVEIFSDLAIEGAAYEGFTTADATGQFIFSQLAGLAGPNVTATATDAAGNTSPFSAPVVVGMDGAAALVVNTTDDTDDGTCNAIHCSLREAIAAANTSVGPDIIAFSIPPSDPGYNIGGWWTIRPGNPLPELSEGGTTIDGSTQTNNRGDTNPLGPEIELDGSLAGDWSQGFMVTSANNVIRGLVINRFTGISKAIRLWGASAGDNRVIGNYLGTDPTGAEGRANDWGIEVWLGAHDNVIGGGTPAERNVISGNNQRGIDIGAEAHDNLIIGNYIGTTAQGTGPLGNGAGAIRISDVPGNIVGPGNVIAHNDGGIWIRGAQSLSNTITANSIYSNVYGISLSDGGNADLGEPVITTASATTVQGTACAGCRVEVFSDLANEGADYEGFATADSAGQFIFSQPGGLTGPNITATATDAVGNTSPFSAPVAVPQKRIFLPLVKRQAPRNGQE